MVNNDLDNEVVEDNNISNNQNNKNNLSTIIGLVIVGVIVLVGLFAFKVIPGPFSSVNTKDIAFTEKIVKVKRNSGIQLSLKGTNSTNIRYQSSDNNIATVNEFSGYVTGIKNGTTTITAYDGNKTVDTCTVEVYTPSSSVNITSLKLSDTNIMLYVGNTKQLKVTIAPSNATNKKIIWSTSNSSVATINSNGVVTAKSEGTATIKVRTENDISATCKVTVKKKSTPTTVAVTSVTLNKTSLSITKGSTSKLTATVAPSNASNKTITWSSSNTSIVTVDKNGNVKGIKEGSATITAKSNNGKTATCMVTVTKSSTTSPTKGKTALFVGDSITYGKDGHYSWANYIGEKYDLKKTVNAGLSGGVLSTFRGEKWLVDVVKSHKGEKYDYVILHGGINDISLVASRGEKKGTYKANDFSGKYDASTFIGGLETYIYTVKKQWPNAKIGYIINYRTPGATAIDPISKEYYNAIKTICKKWNIKYIDLFAGKTSSGQTFSSLLKVNTTTYLSDKVHLNRAGYNVISPYIYKWMKTL